MNKIKNLIKTILPKITGRIKSIIKINVDDKSHKFSKRILFYSLAFITIYTIAVMIIDVYYKIEPNANLTDNVYRFWGLEIALLMIKAIIDGFKEEKETIQPTELVKVKAVKKGKVEE